MISHGQRGVSQFAGVDVWMCVFVFVPVFGAARIKVLLTDTEYDLRSRGAVVESSTDNTVEGPGNGSLAPEGSGSAVHLVCRKQDGNVLPRCRLPVLFATGMGVWAECCLRTRDRDLKAPGSPALVRYDTNHPSQKTPIAAAVWGKHLLQPRSRMGGHKKARERWR